MTMLRAILIVGAVVLAAIGALAGAGFFDGMLRPDEIARERARRIAATGIQARLDQRYGDELRFFIIGRDIDGARWDFRGQVVQGAEAQPLYGVARRVCEPEDAADSACWELERLAVNGAELLETAALPRDVPAAIDAPRAAASAAAVEAGPGRDVSGEDGSDEDGSDEDGSGADGSGGDVSTNDAQEPPAATASDGGDAVAAAAAATRSAAPARPTHVVSGTEVNVRAGPGLEFETIGVSYQGQDLEMLEDKGEWARFRFIGGESDGVEAWLYKPLTRPRG